MQFGVECDILCLLFLHLVECEITADGESEAFHTLMKFIPLVPKPDQCFLYDVLGLLSVASDAKGQSVELVFEWQNIVSETDFFHRLLILIRVN